MSRRSRKWIAIMLVVLTLTMILACLCGMLVSIWTGDDRWAQTAMIALMAGFVCGVSMVFSWPDWD